MRERKKIMLNNMLGIVNTGDDSKIWLIAVCMIVSIIVVVALFIINGHSKKDDDGDDK